MITPSSSPHPSSHEGWCFPDTEEGIYAAVQQGATHLWANTILFSSHPLQTSQKLTPYSSHLHVVGQPPSLVENFDDKAYLNGKLRELGGFTLPRSWIVSQDENDLDQLIASIDPYPVVGKPVRGRGSHGVKVCRDPTQLKVHVQALMAESPLVMLEEFLAGEEATITVLPPSPFTSLPGQPRHWSMFPVVRFNHADGIAPYNGVVAVTANSRVVSEEEMKDPSFGEVMEQCAKVAELIGATAPIRVDVRRFSEESPFALFDINMKPVSLYCSSVLCGDTEMRVATEYDWARASWAQRSSEFDCSGSGGSWMGLWDFVGEYPADGAAFGCVSQVSQSVLSSHRWVFEELCIYLELVGIYRHCIRWVDTWPLSTYNYSRGRLKYSHVQYIYTHIYSHIAYNHDTS